MGPWGYETQGTSTTKRTLFFLTQEQVYMDVCLQGHEQAKTGYSAMKSSMSTVWFFSVLIA